MPARKQHPSAQRRRAGSAALLGVLLVSHALAAEAGGALGQRGRQPARARARALLQDPAPNNKELPRLVIGRVSATVVNTYSWSIQRQATASTIAVTADAYNRQQLGYTLTYTRTLASTQYRLQGVATLTNPSGRGSTTVQGITLVLGGQEVQVPCRGMPGSPFELGPAAVVECPFSQTWAAEPGADTVTGYVQASFGRAPAAGGPVAFTFRGCGQAAEEGGSMWAPCTLVERAGCVSVTDGSYIINKYKDKLGQAMAGPVSRSQLFEASTIQDSSLGPARVEPTMPAATAQQAPRRVDDTPPEWKPLQPSQSWWTGTRRRQLLQQQQQQQQQRLGHIASRWAAGSSPALSSSRREAGPAGRRQLLGQQAPAPSQQQQQQLDALVARYDANFKWPYPQVAGDRPPLGLQGKPQRAAERQVCESRSFSYSMVFGPLLPAACGTFEVQNVAAALPTDGSSPAVEQTTFTYLQVLCPAKAGESVATERAAAPAGQGA